MKLILSLLLQLSLIFLSCQSSDPTPDPLPPTDLTLNIDVAQDGSGKVTATATATNSNYYEFDFGEDGSTEKIRDTDGVLEHTYSAPGTYLVQVYAYSTEETYTIAKKSIMVETSTTIDIPNTGYSSPEAYEGYTLVWQDEFTGSALNLDDWTYELGTGSNGWGNNELQYYKKENTSVQDGYLVIEAKKENFGGRNYTSSRLVTKGKQSFKYGRIDIRAVLPKGQGIWPALWMLGANYETVTWPACGEIDIMELIGGTGKDNTVHGTAHWQNDGNLASYGQHYTLSSGIFADEFHVFSIVWNASSITWYMDDIQFNVIDITPAQLSELQKEFFFIFNMAVGGNWPGNPDASSRFPQRMAVDYVRVFQVK